MANRDVRLRLFENRDFGGRRIIFRRGAIAVRDARALRFNGMLSSFRLRNPNNSRAITLILFSRTDYRGDVRVYRGNTDVRNLGDYDNRMSSFICVGRRLSDAEINRLINRRTPPNNILEILQ